LTDITIKNYLEQIQLTKLAFNLIQMANLATEQASSCIIVSLVAQFAELTNVGFVRMNSIQGKLVNKTGNIKRLKEF
jgi:hypothetical protein